MRVTVEQAALGEVIARAMWLCQRVRECAEDGSNIVTFVTALEGAVRALQATIEAVKEEGPA